MDWVKRMNGAVDYIEANLDDEIDYVKAARIASCSAFHFARVFACMAGTSVAEYVRRRRLSAAAADLSAGEKVIDTALKYGYNSPTAFSRAFAQFHGFAPSEAKKRGATFTSYARIFFQITIKGVTAMNYKIEQKGAIRIVGAKLTTTSAGGQNFRELPAFWDTCRKNGKMQKMMELMDNTGKNADMRGILGVCVTIPEESEKFDYYVAVATEKPAVDGLSEYVIQPSQYAVFESVGPIPTALQELINRVYGEWLPSSGYEYGSGADIEVYSDGDMSAGDYKSWIWVPVRTRTPNAT